MERLTSNEEDFDAREQTIKLLEKHTDIPNEFTCDEDFDDFMMDALQYGTDDILGLIAVFYRNLWAMADLRGRLKEYEDIEEQGKLLKLPCKIGDPVYKVYYADNEIAEKTVKGFSDTGMWLDNDCYQTSFYEIGKTIFFVQKDAEIALKDATEAAEFLADRVIYWEIVRTIGGTEKDRRVRCSNCGNMINLYDIEQIRFDGINGDEQYDKAIKMKYYTCEKCGSKMDVILSRILEKNGIAKGDYFGNGYKKEIVRILISDEYTQRKRK